MESSLLKLTNYLHFSKEYLSYFILCFTETRDIKTWSERMRKPMIEVYGEEYFAKLWAKWCDGMETVFNANNGNICSHLLKDIKCPTLILHGEKDPMVDNVHVSYLHTHIVNSR